MADTYTYWREELKGTHHSRDTLDPIHGFWRIIGARTKPDWPFAVWGDESGSLYKIGRKDAVLADSDEGQHLFAFQWPHAVAVTEAEYKQALDTGYWSDGKPCRQEEAIVDERPKEGQSNYAPAHEVIAERITELLDKVKALGEIDTQEKVNKATDLGVKLRAAIEEADGLFAKDRAPVEEELGKVKEKWGFVKTATADTDALKVKVRAWLKAEAAKAEAAARASAASAPDDAPSPEIERPKAVATYGRAVALRKMKKGKITDMAKFLKAVKDDADVLALLQKKADALARAGTTKPGMEIEEVLV